MKWKPISSTSEWQQVNAVKPQEESAGMRLRRRTDKYGRIVFVCMCRYAPSCEMLFPGLAKVKDIFCKELKQAPCLVHRQQTGDFNRYSKDLITYSRCIAKGPKHKELKLSHSLPPTLTLCWKEGCWVEGQRAVPLQKVFFQIVC